MRIEQSSVIQRRTKWTTAGDAIMEMNMYQLQDFAQRRMKDLQREAANERLANRVREAQREHQASRVVETRNETRRNSSPLWARIWSLF
jgi:hypothetical protein